LVCAIKKIESPAGTEIPDTQAQQQLKAATTCSVASKISRRVSKRKEENRRLNTTTQLRFEPTDDQKQRAKPSRSHQRHEAGDRTFQHGPDPNNPRTRRPALADPHDQPALTNPH
jgi:hypothetical protein